MSSFTRRRETSSAAASSVWVIPSGFRNRDSRNCPGCGGVRADNGSRAGRPAPARPLAPLPLRTATSAAFTPRRYPRGSRLNMRIPLIIVPMTDSPLMMSSRNTM